MRCQRCFEWFEGPDDEGRTPGYDQDKEMCDACVKAKGADVPPLDVEAIFAKGGPLAGGNPAYEVRDGQVRLARAIFEAASRGEHLCGEGPCGVGKSMAYGVPAAWLASHKKKVTIVTASIALQEQLVKKDLPALQKALPDGFDFTFALMKGKSNYLCREELKVLDKDGVGYDDARDFDSVLEWSKSTLTGDKSELLIKPSDLVWGRFSTTSDACPGSKCNSWKSCYARAARDAAAQAGILVTNYHLFFLNMAYGGQILPASDVVILDEAHEAADIARSLLGFRASIAAFRRVAKDARKRHEVDVASELEDAAGDFFDDVLRFGQSRHYHALLRWEAPLDASRLVAAVEAFERACPRSHLADYARAAKERVVDALALKDPNCVYSIDVKEGPRGPRASLEAKFVSPAPILATQLWGGYPSVIAMSATLTTDGRFDFVRGELGVPASAKELSVESPFDFRQQAMLVVPSAAELPEPNDPAFVAVAAQNVIRTIEACGGRTLALFTSYRALNAVYDIVRRQVGRQYRILKQGDMPTGLLAKTFKEDVRSVLLATTSFWTGVDVPGESLTGLVIDRLPFGNPDDPVAIRIKESDPKSFANFTVPKSILTLRQGVGRLIRSQRDIGAIVILDRRVSSKGYGTRFLRSLPPMARASSTAAIAPFLRSKGVAA